MRFIFILMITFCGTFCTKASFELQNIGDNAVSNKQNNGPEHVTLIVEESSIESTQESWIEKNIYKIEYYTKVIYSTSVICTIFYYSYCLYNLSK